ncbi:hypothetical protein DHEL01_v204556 [Diaporthe helianthi]|uniref:Uncharacterized protein n=1 Tax=Diaporthe helianthi TaxID=158607 RepID=A0A2P5I3E9_DIAHE|nr:hypothetical protein DHEL01_v204556 [Diaporthe helianthi]
MLSAWASGAGHGFLARRLTTLLSEDDGLFSDRSQCISRPATNHPIFEHPATEDRADSAVYATYLFSVTELTRPLFQQGPNPSMIDFLKRPYELLRPGADVIITDEGGNGAFYYLVESDMFKPPSCPARNLFFVLAKTAAYDDRRHHQYTAGC